MAKTKKSAPKKAPAKNTEPVKKAAPAKEDIKQVIAAKGLRPISVSVISIYYWVMSIIGILVGMMLLIGGGGAFSLIPGVGKAFGGIIMLIALFVIVYSLILLALAYYLWKLKNWARIVIVVLAVITAIMNLVNTGIGIYSKDVLIVLVAFTGFIVNVLIVYCLGLHRKTTCYFVK